MSADVYVEKVLTVIEELYNLRKYSPNIRLPKDYHQELDTHKFMNDEGVALYQSYMGILHCLVEIVCIDLAFEAA